MSSLPPPPPPGPTPVLPVAAPVPPLAQPRGVARLNILVLALIAAAALLSSVMLWQRLSALSLSKVIWLLRTPQIQWWEKLFPMSP